MYRTNDTTLGKFLTPFQDVILIALVNTLSTLSTIERV